jgi:hypothetical protein
MKMLRIEAGSFEMGSTLGRDYWDESPVHKISISGPFYVSETEVTAEQFRRFKADFKGTEKYLPYAAGVSWYDAAAFCKWLGEKEGRPYRLPTEAEWEYACRAGTKTLYWSGDEAPGAGQANPWGLKNTHTGVREWCLDWYGDYPAAAQVDPVGPEQGIARVVRGGLYAGRIEHRKVFNASSSRASIAPAFGPYNRQCAAKPAGKENAFGYHNIGFRVVQAPMPATPPVSPMLSYARQGIRQNTGIVNVGPDPARPYFRKRYLLPVPPDNCDNETIDAAGMHPSFRSHNHSPALEVCPNGDVLMIIYTSYGEYEPGVSLIGSRLRFGADQWDMPDRMFDFAALNDHAPMLWTDAETGVVYLFWGNPKLEGGFPFHWTCSADSGATWSEVKFPNFVNEVGRHSRQPINTAIRDDEGTLYVASDGSGGRSVLWATRDDGRTWYDTGGRTGGRHTTCVLLKDGKSILGMGGKNTDIDGFMPKSISRDGGKTWEVSKTPLPAQGSNQRPSILRLRSGRLLFAADYQHISGRQPEGITQGGSYVALSEDEGQTWKVVTLIGTQPHEDKRRHNGNPTIGYSAARQAPNGVIHLITTMNKPCLHFAMNEAWILSKDTGDGKATDEELMRNTAADISAVESYCERYPDGGLKVKFSGGVGSDGRFLLHGEQIWYYPDGTRQRRAFYDKGRKTGTETYWSFDGSRHYQWLHSDDGSSVWTQYGPGGQERAQSTWRNFKRVDGPE